MNLSNLELNLCCNSFGKKGTKSLLSPLSNLLNLSKLTLNLDRNKIGEKGVESLLSPLGNLLNLSTLFLDLTYNKIGDIGVYSLFYPLSNIMSLSCVSLMLIGNSKKKLTDHLWEHYFKKLKLLKSTDWIYICSSTTTKIKKKTRNLNQTIQLLFSYYHIPSQAKRAY